MIFLITLQCCSLGNRPGTEFQVIHTCLSDLWIPQRLFLVSRPHLIRGLDQVPSVYALPICPALFLFAPNSFCLPWALPSSIWVLRKEVSQIRRLFENLTNWQTAAARQGNRGQFVKRAALRCKTNISSAAGAIPCLFWIKTVCGSDEAEINVDQLCFSRQLELHLTHVSRPTFFCAGKRQSGLPNYQRDFMVRKWPLKFLQQKHPLMPYTYFWLHSWE